MILVEILFLYVDEKITNTHIQRILQFSPNRSHSQAKRYIPHSRRTSFLIIDASPKIIVHTDISRIYIFSIIPDNVDKIHINNNTNNNSHYYYSKKRYLTKRMTRTKTKTPNEYYEIVTKLNIGNAFMWCAVIRHF